MIDLRNSVELNIGLLLTPELDLSLKLLSMNTLDVEAAAKSLLESNPIVSIDEGINTRKHPIFEDKFKELKDSYKEKFLSEDNKADPIEATVVYKKDVKKELLNELKLEIDLDEQDENIAKFIIYNIDDKGFLDADLKEFSAKLKYPYKKAEYMRKKIMRLEPLGCGSLDYVEFLMLQADIFYKSNSDKLKKLITIIHNMGRKISREKIKEKLNIDESLLEKLLDILSNFALYPLESYKSDNNDIYIAPDIYIKRIDGRLIAIPNDSVINAFKINEDMLHEFMKDRSAKNYIKDKYKEAKNFVLSLVNRNKTLIKIMNIILEKQKRFFLGGALLPLSRKDIAEDLGFNVSTIARSVANKYVEYDGKIFEMKDFFSFGKDGISKSYVKKKVKEIVDAEDKNNPFSDDLIRDMLKRVNINITRRAVTKYRKEMNIPNSRERKCKRM